MNSTSELFNAVFEKDSNVLTAKQLFARLEESEKIDLRRASQDRMQWMAHNTFRTESGQDVEVIIETAAMCNVEWDELQKRTWYNKSASRNLFVA